VQQATVIRRQVDGVQTEELVAGTEPSPPPPRARPNSPVTVVVEIPETPDPRLAALEVLGRVMGIEAAASFRARAARAQADILDHVEEARLRVEVRLDQFIARCAVKLRVRNILTGRADILEQRPGVQPADLATELCSLIMGVARWKDGHALREQRARLLVAAARELVETSTKLRTELPSSVRESHGSDPSQGHHAKGLITREDEWLRRYETAWIRRSDLRQRLARLGRDRASTAKAVVSAIATATASRVASTIAPQLPADTTRVERLESDLRRMDQEIGRTDAATGRHKSLVEQRGRAQAELAEARQGVLDVQADAAAAMIASAGTGDLAEVLALEALVSGIPALQSELGQARGSVDELAATVGLLLEESDLKAQAEVDRIQAQQPRRF
jgi:hypothetical protein